jgi:SAM-dependent methyltransferase
MSRALSFGSVAEQYERYRPDYGEELVDAVFAYAGRRICTAVEVGAGTGKATRLFARRGVDVIALEPDAAMATLLRKTTAGLPVTPLVSTFESYRSSAPVDLVFAAAAWHWTDPVTRVERAADLLRSGGMLALVGSTADLADPQLRAAVEQIEHEMLPDQGVDTEVHPWSLEELDADGRLAGSAELNLPRVVTRSAEEFVGRLATVSAYLLLSPAVRAETLCRVRSVLPPQVEVDATVQVALARRI